MCKVLRAQGYVESSGGKRNRNTRWQGQQDFVNIQDDQNVNCILPSKKLLQSLRLHTHTHKLINLQGLCIRNWERLSWCFCFKPLKRFHSCVSWKSWQVQAVGLRVSVLCRLLAGSLPRSLPPRPVYMVVGLPQSSRQGRDERARDADHSLLVTYSQR